MGRNVYICQNPQPVIQQSTSIISRISRNVIRKQSLNLPQYLEREVYFLNKLAKYDIVPQLLYQGTDYLDLSYCGRSLSTLYPKGQRQTVASLQPQFAEILAILNQEGIQHRDLYGDNLMMLAGKIRLIDWTWAIDETYHDFGLDRVPEEALGQGLWELSGKSDKGCLDMVAQGIFSGNDFYKVND